MLKSKRQKPVSYQRYSSVHTFASSRIVCNKFSLVKMADAVVNNGAKAETKTNGGDAAAKDAAHDQGLTFLRFLRFSVNFLL